jgi:hypothetical protein
MPPTDPDGDDVDGRPMSDDAADGCCCPLSVDPPPSCGYVLEVIDRDGPRTRQELLKQTYLKESTLDWALSWLVDRNIVARQERLTERPGRTLIIRVD